MTALAVAHPSSGPSRLINVLILERSLEDTRRLRDLFIALPQVKPFTARDLPDALATLSTTNIDVALIDATIWLRRNGEGAKQLKAAAPDTGFLALCELEGEGLSCVKRGAQDFVARGAIEPAGLRDKIVAAEEATRANRRRDTLRLWMERAARVDQLTGLQTRKSFSEHLRAACAEAAAEDDRVTVLLIDVAGTSAVNDELGYEAGDELIRRAALGLSRCLRGSDIAGRVGGDEFAVILPGADLEVGRRVARRIRAEITQLNGSQWRGLPPILLNFDVLDATGREPEAVLAGVTGGVRPHASKLHLVEPKEEANDGPSVA
ncbi:MAG: GGDEF domain-containing protein [Dehalococcoidia bacterium]